MRKGRAPGERAPAVAQNPSGREAKGTGTYLDRAEPPRLTGQRALDRRAEPRRRDVERDQEDR